jgi:hypothetical protein
MRKHAFIKDSVVEKIDFISTEQYYDFSRYYHNIIDIEDVIPQPEVGWILEGNKLISNSQLESSFFVQQKTQRLWGQSYISEAIDKIGERNLDLSAAGQIVNTASLLQNMGTIKELMSTGALKTARGFCLQIAPSYPIYRDIIEKVAEDIQNFLQSKGYA